MILHRDLGPEMTLPRAERPVWVVLDTSGPDPRLDRLLGLQALILGEPGETAKVLQLDLAPDQKAQDAWKELYAFAGSAPLLVQGSGSFHAWQRTAEGAKTPHAQPQNVPGNVIVGLEEIEQLATLRSAKPAPGEATPEAETLPERFARVLQWLLLGDGLFVGLWAHGIWQAAHRMQATDARAAERLFWILGALNRPTDLGLKHPDPEQDPRDGNSAWLQERLLEVPDAEHAVAGLAPRASRMHSFEDDRDNVPPTREGLTPFTKSDKRLLEEIFEEHLPSGMVETGGGQADQYRRPSQQAVAMRVADNFGRNGLLLMHAPTGTGKTLAYIVPAMLWAVRHNIRVGVATYTRALQEQAMDGEVPRALRALERAGVDPLPKVALLKGRENYLCWRAFVPQVPQAEDDAESWLVWTMLLTFALTDEFGDLDRLNASPPVRLTASRPYREAMGQLIRATRARKGCCSRPKDRSTCLADLARRRAERSHLVITNQSFVLARQEFLRHVVFDECEHLHDGAVSAWSHRFSFEELRRVLGRLYRPKRGNSRAPLNRLSGKLPFGGTSQEYVGRAVKRWQACLDALEDLEQEAEMFDMRRNQETKGRSERDLHGYLRQRVKQGEEIDLLRSRIKLGVQLARLEQDLDRVLEICDSATIKGQATIRRQLELGRTELIELSQNLDACIPISEEGPRFSLEVFYDVERQFQGALSLVARVLLPFETLGRFYYPDLASASFLSATTYLGGSFEASKNYLGLHRAENPAKDEERVGRPVDSFRVPEVFDYMRVLVGVPRDAPPANGSRDAHRAYVTDFVGQLSERTGGRVLVLFTSLDDVRRVGQALEARLLQRGLLLLYQGMQDLSKEELSRRFRERKDSVLLGVDTFWFGADFPGETLEYLVIARLPYGVPDRYHFAQCAALGEVPQRNQIYMPRALAKFRQGFGRLMRTTQDRGCVFLLDQRVLEPRHRAFMRELPLAGLGQGDGAELLRGPKERVMRAALAHMGLLNEAETRGVDLQRTVEPEPERFKPPLEIDPSDLPF